MSEAHRALKVRDFRSSPNRSVTLDPTRLPGQMRTAVGYRFRPTAAGVNYSVDLGHTHVWVRGPIVGRWEFPIDTLEATGMTWSDDEIPAEFHDVVEAYRPTEGWPE